MAIKAYHGTGKLADILSAGRLYAPCIINAGDKAHRDRLFDSFFKDYENVGRVLAGRIQDAVRTGDKALTPDFDPSYTWEQIADLSRKLSVSTHKDAETIGEYFEYRRNLFVFLSPSPDLPIRRSVNQGLDQAVLEFDLPEDIVRPITQHQGALILVRREVPIEHLVGIYVPKPKIYGTHGLVNEHKLLKPRVLDIATL